MEEKEIQTAKKPWPTRLVDLSYGCLKWGFVLFIIGILFFIFGDKWNWTFFKVIGGSGIAIFMSSFAISFILSLIALLGMPFYGFKDCGVGRALVMLIFTNIVLALGFAIFGPALKKTKDSGPAYARTHCRANMKKIAISFIIYQDENNIWPNKEDWCDKIKHYTGYDDNRAFQCIIDKAGPCSYAMNENIPADVTDLPADLVLLFEGGPGWNQVGGVDDVVTDRHGEKKSGANIAFADGHVEFVEAEEIPSLRWTVENKSVERE